MDEVSGTDRLPFQTVWEQILISYGVTSQEKARRSSQIRVVWLQGVPIHLEDWFYCRIKRDKKKKK